MANRVQIGVTVNQSELDFCMEVTGEKIPRRALARFVENHVDAYMDLDNGQLEVDPQNERKKSTNIYVHQTTKKHLDTLASDKKCSVSRVCRRIINFFKHGIYKKTEDYHMEIVKSKEGKLCLQGRIGLANPEGLLDVLVEKLLEDGYKVHECEWFKRLQEEHPTAVSLPSSEKILAYLKEWQGWAYWEVMVDDLIPEMKGKSGAVGSFGQRVSAMVKRKEIDMMSDKEGNSLYRVHVPDPLTDEDSIMKVLDEAESDWVNQSYLYRKLHLEQADDSLKHTMLGRLYLLVNNGQIESQMKNGDCQWRTTGKHRVTE